MNMLKLKNLNLFIGTFFSYGSITFYFCFVLLVFLAKDTCNFTTISLIKKFQIAFPKNGGF